MNEPNPTQPLQQPNPTVPVNQNIFTSGQNVQDPSTRGLAQDDKNRIIQNVAGPKSFGGKKILIALGAVVLILIILLIGKALFTKVNQNKNVTLTWWNTTLDQAAVNPIIQEFEQQNPNVTINFESQSQTDYRIRLANALQQGKGPDIFEIHNSWMPMFINSLSPSNTDFSNDFYAIVGSNFKVNNKFYAAPLSYDGIALFVNQDILQSYGKTAPKTWDDFVNLAQSLTLRDASGNITQAGAAIGTTSNIDYWQDIFATLALQNGVNLNQPNSTNGESALTFYTKFSNIYHVWDDTLPQSTLDFENGKLAMYFGKYTDAETIRKQFPNLHFEIVPVPQLPSDASTIPSVSYASYFADAVSKQSANSSMAWKFLQFLTTQQTLQELNKNEQQTRGYGIIYPRADMQNVQLTDQTASAFAYQASFAQSWYLADKTFDGDSGINSQVAKAYSDAIDAANGNSGGNGAIATAQTALQLILASYGLVAPVPSSTP
ncbi:MAG TPA: extracellular solute-binding protein [Patescibacteria group bacterium]|nr:extracellular solute-binding protein [Patescibacteria group bacterium]